MPVIADLKEDPIDLTTFKYISMAFTEASAVKLRNIRSAFERNARFYEEVTHLYHIIELSAKRATLTPQISIGPTVKKTLSVAITSNSRFYGALNIEIMKVFLEATKRAESDLIVIGTTGIDYLNSINFTKSYEKI